MGKRTEMIRYVKPADIAAATEEDRWPTFYTARTADLVPCRITFEWNPPPKKARQK